MTWKSEQCALSTRRCLPAGMLESSYSRFTPFSSKPGCRNLQSGAVFVVVSCFCCCCCGGGGGGGGYHWAG